MTDPNQEVCPLCGCPDHDGLFTERKHQLRACQSCDLLFISPYPRRRQDVFDTVAEYDYDDLEILDEQRYYDSSVRFYEKYFPLICEEVRGPATLLDVGCGTGRLLELMSREPGMACVGLELNARRAAYSRKVSQCEVHEVPVESFQPEAKFDAVTLINVFSHVPDLNSFFGAIRGLVADQGKVILKVGEMSKSVRQDASFDWQIPDHLQFLGLGTVEFLAQRFGFSIIRHDRVPQSSELYSASRWRAPGRSRARNWVKRIVAATPFALSTLQGRYERKHGGTIFSSFITLQPQS